jgi:hypothetical protein
MIPSTRRRITVKHSTLGWIATLGAGLALACSSTPDAAPVAQPQAAVSTLRQEGPGSLTQARSTQIQATVVAIDAATRKVELRLPDGRLASLVAGPEVRNLAQVQPGDLVNATFLESMVIQVRRPGDATPGVAAGAGAVRNPEGGMPGAAAVESITLTTTVAEIDREGRSVTLENPDGTRRVVHVRNPEQFDHVAVGDLVEITLTEALAISVERPASR